MRHDGGPIIVAGPSSPSTSTSSTTGLQQQASSAMMATVSAGAAAAPATSVTSSTSTTTGQVQQSKDWDPDWHEGAQQHIMKLFNPDTYQGEADPSWTWYPFKLVGATLVHFVVLYCIVLHGTALGCTEVPVLQYLVACFCSCNAPLTSMLQVDGGVR